MPELKSDEFRCKHCRGVFERKWTEQDALAEYRKIFGKLPDAVKKDKEALCDACYKKLMIKLRQ